MLSNIVAVSDLVRAGNYRPHSQFNKVYNYTQDENTICLSITLSEIGFGPNCISVATFPQYFDHLTLTNDELKSAQSFNSNLPQINLINWAKLGDNLALLAEHIGEKSQSNSVANLLRNNQKSAVFSELKKQFALVILSDERDSFLSRLPKLSGLGIGLTPSGDDIGAGVLIGLHFLSQNKGEENSAIKTEIFKSFKTSNPFSELTLRHAYNGLISEHMQSLISLLDKNELEMLDAANKVMQHGATSGADLLLGFTEVMRRSL